MNRIKRYFSNRIIRESRMFEDMWSMPCVYRRTVVYTEDWFGNRTPLLTYQMWEDHKKPILHFRQPWEPTDTCLEECRKPIILGYKRNHWLIGDHRSLSPTYIK